MAGHPAAADQLTYRPTNPSFGGNPLYGQHLLGVAGAINKYEDPRTVREREQRELDRRSGAEFERIIQSSLLSRISSQIADQIYGENAAPSGTFQIGNTKVDFLRQGGQTNVTIIDLLTGGQTVISIPTPQF